MSNTKIVIKRNGYKWTVTRPVGHMSGYVIERHFDRRWQARQYVRNLKSNA
jgi:hypothetical protein